MTSDNTALRVSRNEAGFWVKAEQIDLDKSDLGMSYVLSQSGVAFSFATGVTTDQRIGSPILVPGGLIGPNGSLIITAEFFTSTVNANAKLCSIRFGGLNISGQVDIGNNAGFRMKRNLRMRNSQNDMRYFSSNVASFEGVFTNNTSAAVNVALDQNVEFYVQLANAADNCTVIGYTIEVMPSV